MKHCVLARRIPSQSFLGAAVSSEVEITKPIRQMKALRLRGWDFLGLPRGQQ